MNESRSRRRVLATALAVLAVTGLSLVHLSVVMSVAAVVLIAAVGRGAIELVERRWLNRGE
jgi:hypothetical protein